MDKPKIAMSQQNKQPLGLCDRGIIIIVCADCGETLLNLQLTDVNTNACDSSQQVETKIAVKCGVCGGFSHVYKIDGQFYPGSPTDKMGFDVCDNEAGAPCVDILFKSWRK